MQLGASVSAIAIANGINAKLLFKWRRDRQRELKSLHATPAVLLPVRLASTDDTLAVKVQTALTEDPYGGHVFVFRGRRGDLVKLLWSDGDGMGSGANFSRNRTTSRVCCGGQAESTAFQTAGAAWPLRRNRPRLNWPLRIRCSNSTPAIVTAA